MQNNIIYLLLILFCSITANGQVTGLVLDNQTGKPVSRVTVSYEGKKLTTTDEYGKFYINEIRRTLLLHFQHLSYEDTLIQYTEVDLKQGLTVRLKKSPQLIEEVVVNTGYQKTPKDRLTGAYSTVGQELLLQQVSKGITSMLPAIASGVMMDNNSDFSGRLMVRGISTIQGDKKPLIILNNFPYEGNIDDINPLDIENVTILKDASASAIWGVRAGNGVIVITTKQGSFSKKTNFSISSSLKMGKAPDLNRLDVMDASEFIGMEEFLYEKGFYDSKINSYAMPALTPIVEALEQLRQGEISQQEYNSLRARLETVDVRQGYKKYFFQNSAYQQHYLQADGGTDRFTWISSLGYDKDVNYNKNKNDRFTYRLNNSVKLLPSLYFSSDINIAHMTNDFGRPVYGNIKMSSLELYPYAEFADVNGNPLRIAQKRNAYIDEVEKDGQLLDWNYYPLLDDKYMGNVGKKWLFNWNTGLKYDFKKYFSIDLKYNVTLEYNHSEQLKDVESYAARNLINSFTEINGNTGGLIYNVPKGGILNRSSARQLVHNGRLQLDFDRTVGQHGLAALIGFEGRLNKNAVDADQLYGYKPNNLSFVNVDYVNQFPDFVTGALNNITNGQYISSTDIRFASVFANAVYSFKRKINLSGSLRRDATNLFGLRTNKKWNLLWSLGTSWRVIDDSNSFLNSLNIRTTYGFSGNVDPNMSSVNTIRYMGVNAKNSLPIALFSSYANPELKWETVGTLNAGIDLKMWNNRVELSMDWYRKYGKDLYGLDINDPTAGIGSTIVRNVAKMSGKGLDLSLNIKAINQQQWKLQFQANLSKTVDRVEQYYLEDSQGWNFINERAIAGIEGRPVYSLFSYHWKGLDTDGNPIGYLDGQESKDYDEIFYKTSLEDMDFGGAVIPRWFGLGGASLTYKDFSFNFRLLYKFGHVIRTKSIDYTTLLSNNITHSDYGERWQKAGDESITHVPVFNYPLDDSRDNFYKYSGVLVESGSHIRLQYVNFQYSPVTNNLKFRYSLFANVENLGVIWKEAKSKIDPDFENSFNSISPSRQWTLGLRLHF